MNDYKPFNSKILQIIHMNSENFNYHLSSINYIKLTSILNICTIISHLSCYIGEIAHILCTIFILLSIITQFIELQCISETITYINQQIQFGQSINQVNMYNKLYNIFQTYKDYHIIHTIAIIYEYLYFELYTPYIFILTFVMSSIAHIILIHINYKLKYTYKKLNSIL